MLGRCLASAANAGPALTPHPLLACFVCWAKRTTVDHVVIWCLAIFPAVARHYPDYTNSRIIFFPQQAQGVESVSLQRWFGVVDGGPALNRCHAILSIPSILGFPSGSAQEGTQCGHSETAVCLMVNN